MYFRTKFSDWIRCDETRITNVDDLKPAKKDPPSRGYEIGKSFIWSWHPISDNDLRAFRNMLDGGPQE